MIGSHSPPACDLDTVWKVKQYKFYGFFNVCLAVMTTYLDRSSRIADPFPATHTNFFFLCFDLDLQYGSYIWYFFRLCNSLPPYEVLNTVNLILLPKKVYIPFAGLGPLLTLNLCGGHSNENLQQGHVETYSCAIHDKRKSPIF